MSSVTSYTIEVGSSTDNANGIPTTLCWSIGNDGNCDDEDDDTDEDTGEDDDDTDEEGDSALIGSNFILSSLISLVII